jgi:hypothetical protein
MTAEDVTYLVTRIGKTSPEALTYLADMLKKQGLEGE